MSEPNKTSQLKALEQAANVMRGIEREKNIDPKKLETQWQNAMNFIGKAGVEIEGTDKIGKHTNNPGKLAAHAREEIEALKATIKNGDENKIQKKSEKLAAEMLEGLKATLLPVAESQHKKR